MFAVAIGGGVACTADPEPQDDCDSATEPLDTEESDGDVIDCGLDLSFDSKSRRLTAAGSSDLTTPQLEVSWYDQGAWTAASLSTETSTFDLSRLVPLQVAGSVLQEIYGTSLRITVSGLLSGVSCQTAIDAEMPVLALDGSWTPPAEFILNWGSEGLLSEGGYSAESLIVRVDITENQEAGGAAGHVVAMSMLGDVFSYDNIDGIALSGSSDGTAQVTHVDFHDGLTYGSTVSYPELPDEPPSYAFVTAGDGDISGVATGLTLHDAHEITGVTEDGLLIAYSLDWSQSGSTSGSTIEELLLDPQTGAIQESRTILDWSSVIRDGIFSNYQYFNFLMQPVDSPWMCTTQRMNIEVRFATALCLPLDAEGRAVPEDMILIANEGYSTDGLPQNFADEFPGAQVIELPRLSEDPEQFVVDGPHAAYWLPDPDDADRALWVGHMLVEKVVEDGKGEESWQGDDVLPTTTYLYDMQRDGSGSWSATMRCSFTEGNYEFFYGTVIIPSLQPDVMGTFYASNRSMSLFDTTNCTKIGQQDSSQGEPGKWSTSRSFDDLLSPENGLSNVSFSFRL
jgi:hypothetical protein